MNRFAFFGKKDKTVFIISDNSFRLAGVIPVFNYCTADFSATCVFKFYLDDRTSSVFGGECIEFLTAFVIVKSETVIG